MITKGFAMELLKQFMSFNKLMKDRLVAAFFLLGLVWIGINFLESFFRGLGLIGGHFDLKLSLYAFFEILLYFVVLRLICELMIAIFHINNNLSPDGGKSEMADLDPIEAAREAAERAAKTARSATKTVVDKTKSRLSDSDDGDEFPDYDDPTPPDPKPAPKPSPKPAAKKPAAKKPAAKKPAAKPAAAKKAPVKKAAAKKTTTKKPAAKTTKKPAPKK